MTLDHGVASHWPCITVLLLVMCAEGDEQPAYVQQIESNQSISQKLVSANLPGYTLRAWKCKSQEKTVKSHDRRDFSSVFWQIMLKTNAIEDGFKHRSKSVHLIRNRQRERERERGVPIRVCKLETVPSSARSSYHSTVVLPFYQTRYEVSQSSLSVHRRRRAQPME